MWKVGDILQCTAFEQPTQIRITAVHNEVNRYDCFPVKGYTRTEGWRRVPLEIKDWKLVKRAKKRTLL